MHFLDNLQVYILISEDSNLGHVGEIMIYCKSSCVCLLLSSFIFPFPLWRYLTTLSQKSHQIHEERAVENSRSAKRLVWLWKQMGEYFNKRRNTHKEMRNKDSWQTFRQQTLAGWRTKGQEFSWKCPGLSEISEGTTSRDQDDMAWASLWH